MVSLPSIQEMFPEHLMGIPNSTPRTASTSQKMPPRHHSGVAQGHPRSTERPRPPSSAPVPYQYPQASSHSSPSSSRTMTPSERQTSMSSRHGTSPSVRPQSSHHPSYSHSRSNTQTSAVPSFKVVHRDPPTSSELLDHRMVSGHQRPINYQQGMTNGVAKGSTPAFRVAIPAPTPQSTSHQRTESNSTSAGMHRPSSMGSSGSCVLSFPIVGSTASGSHTALNEDGFDSDDAEHPGPDWKVKKHQCPHCTKRFNRPSSLRIHVNTHTGARPFQCPYPHCGREFNVNSNMRRHYRNHVRPGCAQNPPSPSDLLLGLPRDSTSESVRLLHEPSASRSQAATNTLIDDSDDDLDSDIDQVSRKRGEEEYDLDENEHRASERYQWAEEQARQRMLRCLSSPDSSVSRSHSSSPRSLPAYVYPPPSDYRRPQSNMSPQPRGQIRSPRDGASRIGSKYIPSSSVYQASTDLKVSTTLRPAFYGDHGKQEAAW